MYQDIINYPHYELKYHKKMTNSARASQFAAFAALSGYYESIQEIDRITEKKINISEDKKKLLDLKLKIIIDKIPSKKEIIITYFIKDKYKVGGSYSKYQGIIKYINNIKREIIFEDNKIIKIDDILEIEGEFISLEQY